MSEPRMGMPTAGRYLWDLREAQHLSRDRIAKMLKTSISQIERIDHGLVDTRSTLLFGYAHIVKANIRHLMRLILDVPSSEEDDGIIWAEFDALTADQQETVIRVIRGFSPDQ